MEFLERAKVDVDEGHHNTSPSYEDDTNVWIHFTDDYAGDVRRWVKSDPGTGIRSQLVEPTNSVVKGAAPLGSCHCLVETLNRGGIVRFDGVLGDAEAAGGVAGV